jgi:hypothetical protein
MRPGSILLILLVLFSTSTKAQKPWSSKHVKLNGDGSLTYYPDEKGNILPDFRKVGYGGGDKKIPSVPVVKVIEPGNDSSQQIIQAAIDEVSKKPADREGFRGAILLRKGTYRIRGTIKITTGGIVLRGEGAETKLVAVGEGQHNLISVAGTGALKEIKGTRRQIRDPYVPVGAKAFTVSSVEGLQAGDKIVVFRPGTEKWIQDLQMNRIEAREGTVQWKPKDYDLHFERVITRIEKNKIYIDNPVVMAMEDQYGGGEIYRYNFDGRIRNVGIENLLCESAFASDTAEDHGWNAVHFNRMEDGWVRNVTARYFGYSCVNLGHESKNVTVDSCQYLEPKSLITGGRRYSFNNDGQLNLVMNCYASEGRHDYVTGQKVRGPNVFYHCRSEKAKADIGPHHRWAVGTLYDNIVTDGEINIQDRGNWGSGHGWSGVTQVVWNGQAKRAAVQDPWVSGKNYVIGLSATRYEGRLSGRLPSEWEGDHGKDLVPASLYLAQVKAAHGTAEKLSRDLENSRKTSRKRKAVP